MYRIILTLFLVLITNFSFAEDLFEYEDKTRDLMHAGLYKEALERMLWYYNEGSVAEDGSSSATRNSFTLGKWKRLADLYPPALEALKDTRNKKAQKLRSGKGSAYDLYDVISIDGKLDEAHLGIQLFKDIRNKYSAEEVEHFWIYISEDVLLAKDFELAKEFTNPIREFSRIYDRQEESLEEDLGFCTGACAESMNKINHEAFVEGTINMIEFANYLGKPQSRLAIQEQALSLVDDPRIRKAVSP